MLDSPEDYMASALSTAKVSMLGSINSCCTSIIRVLENQDDTTRKALLELYRDFQNIELKIIALKENTK